MALSVGLTTQTILTSSTSFSISWTLEQTLTATAYTISYHNTNNTGCFSDSETISGISGSQTMYTLTGLEEATEYSITVNAFVNGGGRTEQDTIIATAKTAS